MTSYRWHLCPELPADHPLHREKKLPPLVRQLLYNRGLAAPEAAGPFLAIDASLAGDPALLPDIHLALPRIYRALLAGEEIAVYGDFDVDGITATAVLVEGLTALGGHVTPYIPHRLQEGHGLNSFALNELREHGATLIITVDCGITGAEQVKKLARSVDIIVTDHHLPVGPLPPALAVIDPQREDSRYPMRELAGVGVAYKLLQAIYRGMGRPEPAAYLDLVALGTVADMMPLLGENRYLVNEGLKRLRVTSRLGLRELMAQASLTPEKIEAGHISWVLAPRLNAAGRMENAIPSYQLLITKSAEEARALTQKLSEMNSERQRLTGAAFQQAREQVLAKGVQPLLVASHADYPGGILGLVAGRLVDEFYHPAIVIQTGDEVSHGSCRSTPEFNITRAIERCAPLLSHFGGHAAAAGFTLPTKNLAQVEEMLCQIASRELAGLDLRPQLEIDAQVRLTELDGTSYQALQQLAPFGQGNPTPLFLCRGVKVMDYRTMGNSGQHLRFRLKQSGALWDAVAFSLGERTVELTTPLDIVFSLEQDEWNGESRLRLNITDFAPTGLNI